MTTYGIKVSKIGADVGTCSDDDLVMSSEINTLKTFDAQTIAPNGTAITHNFGYIPIHLYAGYLGEKSTNIGFVGQSGEEFSLNVVSGTQAITNENMSENACSALVYVFYDNI